MPVRSLNSAVLKWPDRQTVLNALHRWIKANKRADVLRIGCFGSYARNDFGVGSDCDIIIIVDKSDIPFEQRSLQWDTTSLPVPAELLVYTQEEWRGMKGSRFRREVERHAVLLYQNADSD
jgi:predicted nucleotidyltransferase